MKTPRQDPPNASDRNDRLKAALKANIARRKEQARARGAAADAGTATPASPDDASQPQE